MGYLKSYSSANRRPYLYLDVLVVDRSNPKMVELALKHFPYNLNDRG